ncbi:hypothetical protein [Microbacterium sp. ZW T5_56]|uniref:hypothetical protein n=1 Tax=Microbacterium sp. ZW T5_56 TaxID=3378081 RepID=UPI00385260F8
MSDRYAAIRALWEIDPGTRIGYADEVLDNWRQRFGDVPAALREYYTTLGAHTELNHTQDQLVAPADTPGTVYRMDGDDATDVLAFYVENQLALQWGVLAADCGANDPTVQILVDEEWEPTADTVSSFLIAQAHLQRLYAYEDWSEEFLSIDDEALARLRDFLPAREVTSDLYGGVEFFGGPGVVLAYFRDSSSVVFGCADEHLLDSLFAYFARNG